MLRRALLTFALLTVLTAPTFAASRVLDVLESARQAMGGQAWLDAQFIHVRARLERNGTIAERESRETIGGGSFVETTIATGRRSAIGYDGALVWTQDESGDVAILSDDARRAGINDAYRRGRGYWYQGLWRPEISDLGRRQEGGQTFDVVSITPTGGRPFELWFDAATHLVDRHVEKDGRGTSTTKYSDYRKIDGKLLPFRAATSCSDGQQETLQVVSITFEPDIPREVFAPPPQKRDFGLVRGAASPPEPFEFANNHIFIKVKVNGRGPFPFLLDTGGTNIIAPALLHELGVAAPPPMQIGAPGGEADVATIDRLEVAGAFLNRQTFDVVPLDGFIAVEGKPFSGILGYEFFKRFVVRVDYDRALVTLYEPESFAYRGTGVRVPFEILQIIPVVKGEIDGVSGLFQLDSGSRGTLDLTSRFADDHNLIARYKAKLSAITGWGVGGAARSFVVRGKRLAFAGVTLDDPIVCLSTDTRVTFSERNTAGSIGGGLLKRFNIVWDYPHQQIFFEPNHVPATFDRAGLWANAGRGGFEIADVVAGSPAEEAGLKAGDVIVAVDGRSAIREVSLPEFREKLQQAAGTAIDLAVRRSARDQHIALDLRDLF